MQSSNFCIVKNKVNSQARVFSFLLFILLLAPVILNAAGRRLNIHLEMLKGTAKVFDTGAHRGKPILVLTESALKIGQIVETIKDSRALLVYSDGTRFKIKPMTSLEIMPNGLRLMTGNVWFQVVKRGKQFEIETPTMIAGIRGTIFDIAVHPNKAISDIQVFKGAVSIRSALIDSKNILVKSGMTAGVEKNAPPSKPVKFDVRNAAKEWAEKNWTPSDKTPPVRAMEAFIQLMRDPDTSDLSVDGYKAVLDVEADYQRKMIDDAIEERKK
ncbi:FecR domain-containing protein [Candidatus Riflebacteria bacterium]